jgi:hypothetical protein
MTRRGSLAYYLAAWVIGCFSITVALWIRELIVHGFDSPGGYAFVLLGLSFYSLIFGAFLALLGGFLLRNLMNAVKGATAMHWVAAGAMLAPVMVVGTNWVANSLVPFVLTDLPPLVKIYQAGEFFLFLGAQTIVEKGWWLSIPAGAATAYPLYRIERAFAPKEASA